LKKKNLEFEINDFLEVWDARQLTSFLSDIVPIFELYDVDEETDWIKDYVGHDEENVRTIRLIRTVYLISKIAENHAGRLCLINAKFKKLWQRMEKNET
jgi:hypothetical protein